MPKKISKNFKICGARFSLQYTLILKSIREYWSQVETLNWFQTGFYRSQPVRSDWSKHSSPYNIHVYNIE